MSQGETKLPPQNIEAEQCLLGSILLDPLVFDDVADVLSEKDFYDPGLAEIFDALKELHGQSSKLDLVTLAAILRDRGKLEAVGSPYLLAALPDSVPNAAHALEYAKLVRKESKRRELIHAANEVLRDVWDHQGNDVNALVDKAEARLLVAGDSRSSDHAEGLNSLMVGAMGRIDAAERGETPQGIVKTEFKDLDEKLGGLVPGALYILAARPSMGKSSLATSIVRKATIANGTPSALFTLEVSRDQVADTILAQHSRQDLAKIHTPNHTEQQMEALTKAARELYAQPITIDDTPALSLMSLRAKARRLHRRGKLGLLVIDYLQLLSHDTGKGGESRQAEIAEISAGLKSLARELSVPVLALSQLNRSVESREDKRPTLADLRESGAIEQDADVVLMLYRDSYYNPNPQNGHEAQILIRKNRLGPTGSVDLNWTPECVRFDDCMSVSVNFNLPSSPGPVTW